MGSFTLYPNPSTGTAGVDSTIYNSPSESDWSVIRGASAGTAVGLTENVGYAGIRGGTTSGKWDRLHRCGIGFDVSSVTGRITAATIKLYFTANVVDTHFSQLVGITAYTPASNTDIVTGDYDTFANTRLVTDIDLGDLVGGYNTFTLNADGLTALNSAISGSGIFNVMMRMSGDIDNSEPTWSSGGLSSVEINLSDYAGTDHDPKLEITSVDPYTVTITDGVKIGDTVTRVRVKILSVLDGIKIGDILTGIRVKILSVLDGIKIGDIFSSVYVQLTRWTNRTKPSTSWTNRSNVTTNYTDRTKPTTTWTSVKKF